jgi:hypothetical protein
MRNLARNLARLVGFQAPDPRRKRTAKAFLHVGMSKAGSSRIQRVLSANRDKLAAARVLLPKGDDRHYFLARIAIGLTPEQAARQGNHYYGKRSEEALAKEIASFTRQVASGAFDTAILSHEALFRQREEALTTLRDHLARLFETIEVIVYLRDLASQRVSAINQAIKTGRVDLEQALAKSQTTRYSDFLPRLEAVFGRRALHIVPFDRNVFPEGDIARHFAGLCDLDLDVPDAASDRVNESLSAEGVLLADALARAFSTRHGTSAFAAGRAFRPLLERIAGAPFRVPDDIWQALVENARGEASWVRDRYGIEVPLKGEQPPPAPLWSPATIDSLAVLILDLEAKRG